MNEIDLRFELAHRLEIDINDGLGLKESWKKLTEILSDNVSETVYFFNNNCSNEEFFWLSEVFSDVSVIIQSKEFVMTLRKRLAQVTLENYVQISFEIDHTKRLIDYDEFVRSVNVEINYAEEVLDEV